MVISTFSQSKAIVENALKNELLEEGKDDLVESMQTSRRGDFAAKQTQQ